MGTVPLTSGLVRRDSVLVTCRRCTVWYSLLTAGSFLGAWVAGRIYDYYGS
ncbi:hypothetical protein O9993_07005 [Vibrio lentus]|nr:hypothetical protein [Vibrio lentus]